MLIFMISVFRYLLPKRTMAITIWPFVFFKNTSDKKNVVLINHERIHLRQQLELLVLPFYVLYIGEYLIHLIRIKNRHIAYRQISFEREAYDNESDLSYLSTRSFWAMWKRSGQSKK